MTRKHRQNLLTVLSYCLLLNPKLDSQKQPMGENGTEVFSSLQDRETDDKRKLSDTGSWNA